MIDGAQPEELVARTGEQKEQKGGTIKEIKISFDETGHLQQSIPDVLREAGKEAQVIFLQDLHSQSAIRGVISDYKIAMQLHEQGITDYLIEGSVDMQSEIDKLDSLPSYNLYDKSGLSPASFGDRSFADAIYAMHAAGIRVRTIDTPLVKERKLSAEEREAFLLSRVEDVLSEGGKPFILIGGLHTIESNYARDGVPSLATRLKNEGKDIVTLRLTNIPLTDEERARQTSREFQKVFVSPRLEKTTMPVTPEDDVMRRTSSRLSKIRESLKSISYRGINKTEDTEE